jgi:hypothetical protein
MMQQKRRSRPRQSAQQAGLLALLSAVATLSWGVRARLRVKFRRCLLFGQTEDRVEGEEFTSLGAHKFQGEPSSAL